MLEGTLSDFSLPDIFQLISLTKKTGALTVTADGQDGRVLFRGGEVSFAVSDVRRVALGARLVAAGLVGEEQVTRALERKRDEGGDVVALLLDEAALDEAAVDTFLRSQIEDAVFDLMRLDLASFSFDASEEDAAVGLTVPTEQLITEGGRRMEEWSAIREQIPSSEAVLLLCPEPAADNGTVTVGVAEWGLLALVDGRRTVRDIVELSGKGEFAIARLLADLVKQGFVQAAESGDADGGAFAGMVSRREMLRRLEELELGEPVMRPESPAPSEPAPDEAPAEPPAFEDLSQGLLPPAPHRELSSVGGGEGVTGDGGTAPAEAVAPPAGDFDRAQAAREFASLGLDEAVPPVPQSEHDGGSAAEDHAHQAAGATTNGIDDPAGERQMRPLTRDEDVNKGLLLRLIDGVKGA